MPEHLQGCHPFVGSSYFAPNCADLEAKSETNNTQEDPEDSDLAETQTDAATVSGGSITKTREACDQDDVLFLMKVQTWVR